MAVQGLKSDVTDLTLRSGKSLVIELGAAVVPTPTLTRDTEASSSITVPVYDPSLNLFELSLLSQKFDAHVDGLRFRYLGTSKSGKVLTVSFEDEVIARLRELTGPKKAFRAKQTRANFICGLVEELKPDVPIHCPQRHEKQPVEKKEPPQSARQSKKAAGEAKENRGKGIGDTKGLKIKGQAPSPAQKELAETALRIASDGGAPFICQVAVIAALIDETDMGAVASNNVLEALEPYTQIRPAEQEISGFLFGKPTWTGVTAVGYAKENPQATYYEIAQAVQKSGAGESTKGAANYGQFGDEARQWVEAYGGATAGELSSGSIEVTEPYTFQVGKKETYWGAIQRLAKEVNWRAFVVAGRFFFISEPELSRGQVRLAIERKPGHPTPSNDGIIDVDFDYNANKTVTEVTVTALAEHWEPPPGAVVTLAGYGPASLGAGDAPLPKGQTAVASAVKASTHEGKGRFLVASIESPLRGELGTREITIKLTKPTQPLPEKAATTKTQSSPVGATASNAKGIGGYVSPVSKTEWDASRVDMGVDFINHSASSKVFAIGNAKIIKTGAPGWPGGGGVLYELLDGSRAGQIIYCYENVLPHVTAGQQVRMGEVIATMKGTGYPWIEIGFADAGGQALGTPEHSEGANAATKPGEEMRAFLDQLGAP